MKRVLIGLCLLGCWASAYADGGRLRLHQAAGPFVVTLFTTPDPLRADDADFSVALEQASGGLVEDATVRLILTPMDEGERGRMQLAATHQAATSAFMQAADVRLPHAGSWKVTVEVQRGSESGECSTVLDVLPRRSLGGQIFWEIALVPIAMLLFGVHRWVRRAQMRRV
ncbi:MAG TPA: hypothetical protein VNW54_07395 [Granulicella sp.]|nr:hypothetical protein [Granulicella sp.]